jgi:hypothetical protein
VKRVLAVAGGVAALLALVQVDASRKASRAAAEGSRLAVEIFGDLTSETLDLNVQSAIIRDQFSSETEARAVSLVAAGAPGSGLGAVARADLRAAKRLEEAWGEMLGKPLGLQALPLLVAEQARVKRRGEDQVARQNAAMAESDRYARRAGGASRGLLLVATAAALFTLAGSLRVGRPAWVAVGAGTLVLGGAVVTGGLALTV